MTTGKEIFLAEIAKELSGTDLDQAIAALPEDERKNYDHLRDKYNRRDPAEEIQNRVSKCEAMAAHMRQRRAALIAEYDQKMAVIQELAPIHENAMLSGESTEATKIWQQIRRLKVEAAELLDQAGSIADLDRVTLYDRIRNDPFSAIHQEALAAQEHGVKTIDELEINFQIALREAVQHRTAFLSSLRKAGQLRDKAAKVATVTSRAQHYLRPDERQHLGAGKFTMPKPEAWPVTDHEIQRYFGYTWGVWPDSRMIADRDREWAAQEWSRLVDKRNRIPHEKRVFERDLDRRLERLHRVAFGG